MPRVALTVLILILSLQSCIGDARLPQRGDYVKITQVIGSNVLEAYTGYITDISDGMLCLNCTMAYASSGSNIQPIDLKYPFDVCFGTGSITTLVWPQDG